MVIHFNATKSVDLRVNDNSYRYRAIRGEHSLTLYFSLTEHVEIPLGAWCEFEGEVYTLEKPENFKMLDTRNFEYTLVMDSRQARLRRYKFKDTVSRRLKFTMTGRASDHLQMLVDNLNLRETEWSAGDCADSTEKPLSYNHTYCLDALNQIADAFETEWEIVGKTIHLKKVEYFRDNPLPLSYGRGNGFRSGVGRANEGETGPVEILYVQGGERNIDPSRYGGVKELLLPKDRTLEYGGRTYVSDADGFSIRRADGVLRTFAEDSLDCSHLYPSRTGEVTGVEVVDAGRHFYDFFDATIPADLDFSQCRIDGETINVVFQTGSLAGKEFELEQSDTAVSGYVHAERRFKLVPQELDGVMMPNDVFRPRTGDKYAVFGMMMPEAYVCDDATQTGASWNMFREAAKYLYEHGEQRFTFTGELDGIWAKSDWLNVGGRIKPGGYVWFSDERFQPDGVAIRITGVKDRVNNPYSPVVELSNSVAGGTLSSELRRIGSNEVVTEDLHRDALQFTKRRFRDSMETMKMLEDALLENFTESINPIAVRTMQMLVGDESLQFRFVNGRTNPTEVAHNVVYDAETKVLRSPAGTIQHLTLGIKTLSSGHATGEYKFWDVGEFNSPPLTAAGGKYYLYAKVSATDETGEFRLSESAIAMNGVAGYYHLLMGILNAEYDGERSYVSLYGFTEILPGRITANRVVSSDGQNFMDFLNNAFRIGNSNTSLDFNTSGNGRLVLRGTLVQSPSGTEQPIGCFRGEWDAATVYYRGDEVTHDGSTYRFTHEVPGAGELPTNAIYWATIAERGADGADGTVTYTWIKYADTAAGGGLSDSPAGKDYIGFAYNRPTATESDVPEDYTWSLIKGTDGIPGADGQDGIPGAPGADGQTTYTWIKYADTANGAGMYDIPTAATEYIGIATNKTTATESNVPGDYTWSKFKGDQGVPGATGDRGADGSPGDFFEYRYAKNGSTGIPPVLAATEANPEGWTTTMPDVGALEYLWMTSAKKSAVGALLQNWGAPVRTSGIPGEKGERGDGGPSVVFRGEYSSDATYYGTEKRIDAVKYQGLYYVARTDAGEFTGVPPTDGAKWNDFGAQFESVATYLLLAENANIGDWIIKEGKIMSPRGLKNVSGVWTEVSVADESLENIKPGIHLDATNRRIVLNGISELGTRAELVIDGKYGYISIYENNYERARFEDHGMRVHGSGIPISDTNISSDSTIAINASCCVTGIMERNLTNASVLGVYGNAKNNYGPAFGGYFWNLMARGLYIACKQINWDYEITEHDVYLSCYNTSTITLYLPKPKAAGKIYYMRRLYNHNVAINAYSIGGKQIMGNDGVIYNSINLENRSLIILIWDGQYWISNTTAEDHVS